ncbi:LytR C-terminal domain-containing protein [Corynebacterium sp. 335C]
MNQHRTSPAARSRRSALAYGVIVAVLAVAAIGSWIVARGAAPESVPVACARPDAGAVMPSTELVGVAAAAPSAIPVRVVNGGGESGAATSAADALSALGFAQAADPVGNDPLSPAQDMDCHGQIRFPAAELPKAATLHLVLPCFELVRADRPDGTVEVSVGSGFTTPDDSKEITAILEALNRGEEPPAGALDAVGHATC